MKKLKKLTLKKEVIANLSEDAMGNIKGGASAAICIFESSLCGFTGGTWDGTVRNTQKCGGYASDDCTKPPRCCYYGCCETVNC